MPKSNTASSIASPSLLRLSLLPHLPELFVVESSLRVAEARSSATVPLSRSETDTLKCVGGKRVLVLVIDFGPTWALQVEL